jgi:hypothetical protein
MTQAFDSFNPRVRELIERIQIELDSNKLTEMFLELKEQLADKDQRSKEQLPRRRVADWKVWRRRK